LKDAKKQAEACFPVIPGKAETPAAAKP